MNKKIYKVLSRPLRRWRMSAAWMAGAVCFAFPAYGQLEAQYLNVIAGNESATIEWSDLAVTSIEVDGKTIDRPATPCVVTGLTNGQLYRVVLNHPEITSSEAIVGSWVITRDEGYELYYGERDEWAYDIPLEAAEETKLTFLPNGKAYQPDVFGLPDRDNAVLWSLSNDNLTINYEEEDSPMSLRVLSLTSSEMVLELFEKEITEDIDRNGDGVINEDDFNYIEFYQKATLRKVSQYTSVYAIPGEPFAPQNVAVVPDNETVGQATVSWVAPSINDAYPTIWMNYLFTINGKPSEDFYLHYEETNVARIPSAGGLRHLLATPTRSKRGAYTKPAPTHSKRGAYTEPVTTHSKHEAYSEPVTTRSKREAYTEPVTTFAYEALTGTAYNLPADGKPHSFRLVAARYLTSGEGGPGVKVVGQSEPVTYTKNEALIPSGIYASGGRLYVQTSGEGTLAVYALNGQLHRQQHISMGFTSIPLAKGVYLVTFGGRTTKVYVR
jgi:hypothetical protein